MDGILTELASTLHQYAQDGRLARYSAGAAAAVFAAAVLHSFFKRLMGPKLPPKVTLLCDLPIPFLGDIFNTMGFFIWAISNMNSEAPWDVMIKCSKKHGRVFRSPFLNQTAYNVMGREGVKLGLTCKNEDGEFVMTAVDNENINKLWGPHSLSATPLGPKRTRIKKAFTPALNNASLEAYFSFIQQDVRLWVDKYIASLPEGAVIKTFEPVQELLMVIPIRVVLGMGLDATALVEKTRSLVVPLWDGTFAPPFKWLGGNFAKGLKCREELIPIIQDMISDRKQKLEKVEEIGTDMLSHMVRTMGQSEGLSVEEIIDQVVVIFLASYETTVSLVTAAFHYMAMPKYAHVIQKLREEQERFPEGCKSYADVVSCTYTTNFINEILRLKPAVQGFFRKVTKTFTVDGYTIPEGALYMYHATASQRNTVEDPEELIPERHDQKGSPLRQTFGFTPFASGEFQCAGKNFTVLEATLLLHEIVKGYDLEHASQKPPKITYEPFMRPSEGQPMRFRKRRS